MRGRPWIAAEAAATGLALCVPVAAQADLYCVGVVPPGCDHLEDANPASSPACIAPRCVPWTSRAIAPASSASASA